MEMRIGPRLRSLLEQKQLSFEDLISAFFAAVPITHLHVGQLAGMEAQVSPMMDSFLQADMQVAHTSQCRSLLERVLIRFQAQYALDRHNASHDPERSRHLVAQKVWIWALQESLNITEHEGLDQGTSLVD